MSSPRVKFLLRETGKSGKIRFDLCQFFSGNYFMSGSVPFARFVAVGVLLLAVLFGWTIPGCRFLNARRTTYSSFEAEQLSRENAQNPLQVRDDLDPYQVWETTVDVVRLYFDRIIDEYPCQRSGETITEGLLRTKPQTGSTCFEPWRRDSVNASERHYATVQSIRRTAKIRVRHANGHYIIHVRVDKELEDLAQPSYAQLPSATFRLDTQIPETTDPIAVQDYNEGWLPQGRDYALEQSILNQLQVRLDALSHAQL